jgi:hypothetical protein
MTDQKDLTNFDPSEWEATSGITTEMAMREMLAGRPVAFGHSEGWWALVDGRLVTWVGCRKQWEPWPLPHPVKFRTAVRKPKPAQKPSTDSEILSALKCGKPVLDADGRAVKLWRVDPATGWEVGCRFPLAVKARRRASRDAALIAMVNDPRQRVWDEAGLKYSVDIGITKWWNEIDRKWVPAREPLANVLYLDPPEGEG